MHCDPLYALRRGSEQEEEANVRARVGDELDEGVLHEDAVAAPGRHHVRKAIDGEHHPESHQLRGLFWIAQHGTLSLLIQNIWLNIYFMIRVTMNKASNANADTRQKMEVIVKKAREEEELKRHAPHSMNVCIQGG